MLNHSDSIVELERAFNFWNDLFYQGKLPIVIITIQSAVRQKALGWFAKERWENREKDHKVSEINIAAEILTDGEQAYYTLLHEMVHLDNEVKGQKDTSRHGRYHNKVFKESAEKVGFIVEKSQSAGWCYTEPSDTLKEQLTKLNPNLKVFEYYRFADKSKQTKKRQQKWTCGCVNVWAESTKVINAVCEDCGNPFEVNVG